jgi:hypothetical protein
MRFGMWAFSRLIWLLHLPADSRQAKNLPSKCPIRSTVGGSVQAGRDFVGGDQTNYAGPPGSGTSDLLCARLAELQEISEVAGVVWGDLAGVEAADKATALVERCATLGSFDRLKRMADLLRPALKALLAG